MGFEYVKSQYVGERFEFYLENNYPTVIKNSSDFLFGIWDWNILSSSKILKILFFFNLIFLRINR